MYRRSRRRLGFSSFLPSNLALVPSPTGFSLGRLAFLSINFTYLNSHPHPHLCQKLLQLLKRVAFPHKSSGALKGRGGAVQPIPNYRTSHVDTISL